MKEYTYTVTCYFMELLHRATNIEPAEYYYREEDCDKTYNAEDLFDIIDMYLNDVPHPHDDEELFDQFVSDNDSEIYSIMKGVIVYED